MTRTNSKNTSGYEKIIKKHKTISKYLKRSGKELKKKRPDLDVITRLQQKATAILQELTTTTIKKQKTKSQKKKRPSKPHPTLTFKLSKISERNVKKFGTYSCAYKAQVSGFSENSNNLLKDFLNSLETVFSNALDQVRTKCKLTNPEKDRIRVMVTSNHLKKPLSTRLVNVSEQHPSLILSEIAKVLQSEEELPLDESFGIDIVALKAPVGRGKSFKVLDYSKHTKLKRSIITVKNKDDLCCARALVTGRELANKGPKVKQMIMGRPVQKRLAFELHKTANVALGACGLEEIDRFQDVLKDFQIVVISFSNRNSVIYEGPKRDKRIILYFNNNHFDLVNPDKLPAFFGKRIYCNRCNKYYNQELRHPCFNICVVCQRRKCLPSKEPMLECPQCNKFCRSQECFLAHQKERKGKNGEKTSNCQQSFRCTKCNSVVDSERKHSHVCNEYKCWNCKEYVLPGHLCYMKIEDPKPPSEKLIFFDFESDQSSGEHIVNFAVAQDFSGTTSIFKGYDALHNFCSFLFDVRHTGVSAIAHFAQGYDSLFVLRWLLENKPTADVRLIRSGLKILELRVKDYDIRVIDSLNWFQMPLSKLPKTFGLDESQMSKGTFPHLFNKKENFGYVGSLPDLKYYSPDSLSEEARSKLIAWHSELREKNYVFNFDQELERYCIQDVKILRESCIRFRELFLSEMNVDPFLRVTIASTVMAIYKTNFLQPNIIGIVPNDLYRGVQKLYSKSAIQWLDFISFLTDKNVMHVENEGEHKIVDPERGKTYYVDGFCTETNEVFEFLGCMFHSHDKCFDCDSFNPLRRDIKNSKIYRETMERIERLEQLGYDVKYIWECDFQKLSQTPAFKTFIVNHEIVGNLHPRDAFYGGRTNAVKLYYSCKPGEKIKYVDFTSLYPYIMYSKVFPTSHPVIIRKDFVDISQYFGIIKCKVLAPQNLFFPVLPVKLGGKLVFPLCVKCALTYNNESCTHSVQDRSFWGTWCSNEVQKAVKLGYKVLEIKEVWHFEHTSTSLFSEYVRTFLRSKQESSDYPEWVQTQDDRQRYIDDYFQHEGVKLRPEKIENNPGLRAISKMCLNSLWGKFGMNTDRENTELVFDARRFYEVVNDAELDLLDLYVINEDVVELVYKKKKEVVKESNVTNIFIAIFTTAWARLELYNLISKLGKQVLYFDTDSCIYISKNDGSDPPLSDYLGGLTDEITKVHGREHYITDFVSCGSKNYGYRVSNGTSTVRVKGFRLNYKSSQLINMDSMKSLVNDIKAKKIITVVDENKITREPVTRRIVNKREEKKYQLVYDKRIIVDGGSDTIPFGYDWNPVMTAKPSLAKVTSSVTSLRLYSNGTNAQEMLELGELFPYDNGNDFHDENKMQSDCEGDDAISVDLMQSSESEESEGECTFQDLEFLDDEELHDHDLSFYRSLENET